jgi:hypothetical protein
MLVNGKKLPAIQRDYAGQNRLTWAAVLRTRSVQRMGRP